MHRGGRGRQHCARGVHRHRHRLRPRCGRGISAGAFHSCALLADGTASCWGRNESGQLGSGTNSTLSNVPVAVSGLTDAEAISAGVDHTCALRATGTVACWGLNSDGQLGDGTQVDSNVPVTVSGITNAVAISAGWGYSFALLADGTGSCWGRNGDGQLGNGTTNSSDVPATVPGITDAIDFAAGDYHTCAVLDGNREVLGPQQFRSARHRYDRQLCEYHCTGIGGVGPHRRGQGLGWAHAHLCRTDRRSSLLWGRGLYGRLGNGATANSNVPVPVSGITTATDIVAGSTHTCAVLARRPCEMLGFQQHREARQRNHRRLQRSRPSDRHHHRR